MSAIKMLDMYKQLPNEVQTSLLTIVEYLYHRTKTPSSFSIFDMNKAKEEIKQLGFEKEMGGAIDDFENTPAIVNSLPEEVKEDMKIFDEDGEEEIQINHPIMSKEIVADKVPDYAVMLAFVNFAKLQKIKAKERVNYIPAAIIKKDQLRKLEKSEPVVYKQLLAKYKVPYDKARNYVLASHIMGLYDL